jgi:hypothetical protein
MPWWAVVDGLVGAVQVYAGLTLVNKIGAGPFVGFTVTQRFLLQIRSPGVADSSLLGCGLNNAERPGLGVRAFLGGSPGAGSLCHSENAVFLHCRGGV